MLNIRKTIAVLGIAFVFTWSVGAAPTEYQVKAAFLYYFAKFVEWPKERLPQPGHPFEICVLGQDPFGSVLEETFRGKQTNGSAILLLRTEDIRATRGCQIAFISSSEKDRLPEVFDSLEK